jgi:hypothetical protein
MNSINRLRESDLEETPELASKLPLKYIPLPKHRHGKGVVRNARCSAMDLRLTAYRG